MAEHPLYLVQPYSYRVSCLSRQYLLAVSGLPTWVVDRGCSAHNSKYLVIQTHTYYLLEAGFMDTTQYTLGTVGKECPSFGGFIS